MCARVTDTLSGWLNVGLAVHLVQHVCLRNAAIPARVDWRLGSAGRTYSVAIHSRFETADYGLLHEAALAGMGLFVTFETTIREGAGGRPPAQPS